MQTLIFTAESSYARFRCPYTTTSALTFLTIHPIAVKGLIGAILGIEYDQLYDYTKEMKIGIQILNPVYKDTQAFNLIATSNNNKAQNFQSRVQFLRDVKYRIFVVDEEKKLNKIQETLMNHAYVFTPYLGCSEHIAKLKFEDLVEAKVVKENIVHTVVPKEYVQLNFQEEAFYIDRIPIRSAITREYTEYSNVVFGINEGIIIHPCEIFKVGERNVFFF